jgi:hypothetical protein
LPSARNAWIRELISPLALLALLTLAGTVWIGPALDGIEKRLDSITNALNANSDKLRGDLVAATDKVRDEVRRTNLRIDRVLEQQTVVAGQVGRVEAELGYLRTRFDGIANRLQVSAAPVPPTFAPLNAPISSPDTMTATAGTARLSRFERDIVRGFAEATPKKEQAVLVAASPGTTLPANVSTYGFAPEIEQKVPAIKGRVFAETRDGIAIVEPTSRRVVEILPANRAQ